jgi:hypothetical protein
VGVEIALSARGRALRLGAAGLVLAGLAYGTVWGRDDHFPFGPMVQYAFAADPNGTVPDLYIEATTTAGTTVKVLLTPEGVGIGRAEIEGQLDLIRADPSRLQAVAEAQRRLHPEQPQFTTLTIKVRQILLRHAVKVGERTETLATWTVR